MAQVMANVERDRPQHLSQSPVRSAVRFPLQLAVTINTPDGQFSAVTENISSNGILFSCEYLPEVNSTIEFTMVMPSSIMGSDKDVEVHCVGRVVRHQLDGQSKKAAVAIDEYFLKA